MMIMITSGFVECLINSTRYSDVLSITGTSEPSDVELTLRG